MKNLSYETSVESKEDLVRMLDYQVLVIVCIRTWYVGTVCVLKSLVVTSGPLCKWAQKKNNVQ